MSWTRREMFRGLVGALAAGAGTGRAWAGRGGGGGAGPWIPPGAASGPPAAGKKMFDADHWSTLTAAMERLLPGAIEAGVPEYVMHWLRQEPYNRMVGYFRAGAAHLDRIARRLHGKHFVECRAEEQDPVLAEFQAGNINVKKFRGKVFFQQLFELVLEGWLSHPKYGGNRDRVGWKYIGKPDGLRSCWWNPKGVQQVLHPEKGFHD